MASSRLARVGVGLALLSLAGVRAFADDVAAVRADLERALPKATLNQFFAAHPLVFRGVPPRGATVYRDRVNGVVLIASTSAVATGVLVSERGDIITNEHVVQAAHHAQGAEWMAVWFKPSNGVRPTTTNFLLAKVIHRSLRHDLAHLKLSGDLPPTAKVVPMAAVVPEVGQEVFTIGHPKTYLWSFGQGVVAQIRADYQWKYGDGVARSATAIQTQAPSSPGSSGGPLLNEAGAIVGIVVGSPPDTQGVYFAVSVQHVRELLSP